MLCDLNVPWPCLTYNTQPTQQQLEVLKNTIVTLYSLGYTHQAINFSINENVRIPVGTPDLINPINIAYLKSELVPRFPKLKLFTRLTIIVSDPSKLASRFSQDPEPFRCSCSTASKRKGSTIMYYQPRHRSCFL